MQRFRTALNPPRAAQTREQRPHRPNPLSESQVHEREHVPDGSELPKTISFGPVKSARAQVSFNQAMRGRGVHLIINDRLQRGAHSCHDCKDYLSDSWTST